jgi:hypothetical protein
MNRSLWFIPSVILLLLLPLGRRASAQEATCGAPPALPTTTQTEERIKGQLQGQADFLSKLVGKAELAGQIDAARKQLYQSSDKFFAAQKDAYLSYLFCVLITQDTSLSTAEKLKALETYRNSGQPTSGENPQPDVTLALVYPESPAVMLVNASDAVAREIKYWAAIWNLETRQLLPIPVASFDYIRRHEAGGPQTFFGQPNVDATLKAGNRLAGVISVTCPNCVASHSYWVYLIWGQGGWFSKIPDGHSPSLTQLLMAVPDIVANPDRFFSDIPPGDRVPIAELQ